MPNWCYNSATVQFQDKEQMNDFLNKFYSLGPEIDIDYRGLKQIVRRKMYRMYGILPIPANPDGTYKVHPTEIWGTKWDIDLSKDQLYIKGDDSVIQFSFDTAWGPPIEFFRKITELYPTCRIFLTYDEPGMAFAGKYSYDLNGEINEDVCYGWSNGKPYFDFIINELQTPIGDYFAYNYEKIDHDATKQYYVQCPNYDEIVSKKIYDIYEHKCTGCDSVVLLPIIQRVQK